MVVATLHPSDYPTSLLIAASKTIQDGDSSLWDYLDSSKTTIEEALSGEEIRLCEQDFIHYLREPI